MTALLGLDDWKSLALLIVSAAAAILSHWWLAAKTKHRSREDVPEALEDLRQAIRANRGAADQGTPGVPRPR